MNSLKKIVLGRNIDWVYTGLICMVVMFWSTSYVGIRYSIKKFSPENIAFLRYLSASIVLIIVVCFKKIKLPSLKSLPGIVLLGFTGVFLYNLFLNSGMRTVNAGIASFVINMIPFFTMLLVILRNEEKISGKDWLGLSIAFAGVMLIIFTKNNGFAFDYNVFYILGAAVCMAIYIVVQKKFLIEYSPIELMCYGVWIGTTMLFFFSRNSFLLFTESDLSHKLTILYLGIFPGLAAYLIMAYALKKYKATTISSYILLVPFITLLLGWSLLSEIPSLLAFAGGIMIVIGLVIKNKPPSVNESVE